MVERRRYIPDVKPPRGKPFMKGGTKVDGRQNNGRPKGAINRMSREMKEIMFEAMAFLGAHPEILLTPPPEVFDAREYKKLGDLLKKAQELHGKPAEVMALYVNIIRKEYHEGFSIFHTINNKLLPAQTQVTGPNNGPLQLQNIPPDVLARVPESELTVFGNILDQIAGNTVAAPVSRGNPEAYARAIGVKPPLQLERKADESFGVS